jgi:hypothetical protein
MASFHEISLVFGIFLLYCLYRCCTIIVSILAILQFSEHRKIAQQLPERISTYYTIRAILAVLQFPVHMTLTLASFFQLLSRPFSQYHKSVVNSFFTGKEEFTSMIDKCNIAIGFCLIWSLWVSIQLKSFRNANLLCKYERYVTLLWAFTLVFRCFVDVETLWMAIR